MNGSWNVQNIFAKYTKPAPSMSPILTMNKFKEHNKIYMISLYTHVHAEVEVEVVQDL